MNCPCHLHSNFWLDYILVSVNSEYPIPKKFTFQFLVRLYTIKNDSRLKRLDEFTFQFLVRLYTGTQEEKALFGFKFTFQFLVRLYTIDKTPLEFGIFTIYIPISG